MSRQFRAMRASPGLASRGRQPPGRIYPSAAPSAQLPAPRAAPRSAPNVPRRRRHRLHRRPPPLPPLPFLRPLRRPRLPRRPRRRPQAHPAGAKRSAASTGQSGWRCARCRGTWRGSPFWLFCCWRSRGKRKQLFGELPQRASAAELHRALFERSSKACCSYQCARDARRPSDLRGRGGRERRGGE